MPITANNPLTEEDLKFIKSRIYEARAKERTARKVFAIDNNYPNWAESIEYKWYDRSGKAEIIAAGANADDVPFIDAKGDHVVKPVYTIATGFTLKRQERQAAQAMQSNGVPSLNTRKLDAARKFIADKENSLAFAGDPRYGIQGVINHPGINKFDAANPGSGTEFENKTPDQIAEDIYKAISTMIGEDGIFTPKVLGLAPKQYAFMSKRMSAGTNDTLLSWMLSQLEYIEDVIQIPEFSSKYNGLGYDVAQLLDNERENMELTEIEPITVHDPVYDILENSKQGVEMRTAGLNLYYPEAVVMIEKV